MMQEFCIAALIFMACSLVEFLFSSQCKPLSKSMLYPSDLSAKNVSINRATQVTVLKAEIKYTGLICLKLIEGLLC